METMHPERWKELKGRAKYDRDLSDLIAEIEEMNELTSVLTGLNQRYLSIVEAVANGRLVAGPFPYQRYIEPDGPDGVDAGQLIIDARHALGLL